MDPDHLLDLLAELWTPRAHAKKLELARLPSTGAAHPFYSDPLRLRQVLENLINNAIKFTDSGKVEMQLEHTEDFLVFTISDTGPGIAEKEHARIFQPFWQVSDATTRSAGGTGLGLYICQQIVQLLGGKVWLDHSTDAGTAFKVRLPNNVQGQTGLHRSISSRDQQKDGNTANVRNRKTTRAGE
jgi:signal transduction histidine kinase